MTKATVRGRPLTCAHNAHTIKTLRILRLVFWLYRVEFRISP